MSVDLLIGAQWGDEGKGKWVDILCKDTVATVRYQGGNNAGHTLYIDGKKVVLHLLPSGVFRNLDCYIGAGVVVNPIALRDEIIRIQEVVGQTQKLKIFASERAHTITPWHLFIDTWQEQKRSNPIGTTKRGIGPAYADKAKRMGIRLSDVIRMERRNQWKQQMMELDPLFAQSCHEMKEMWNDFENACEFIKAYVCDVEFLLRQRLQKNEHILVEGAQGSLLDLDHGTYPFVTSSSTTSGGACASLGIAPKHLRKIIGVTKAYTTRVGEGPMPTELHDFVGQHLATVGVEKGATTGRPRRCGWLDLVALKHSCAVNGFTEVILNKMDVLSGLDELLVATSYELDGKMIDYFPSNVQDLARCKPIYKSLEGWQESIVGVKEMRMLPSSAQEYIRFVQEYLQTKISWVGTGVNREDAIAC